MPQKIFILGANGFIGSSLIEHILEKTDWQITGLDLQDQHINRSVIIHDDKYQHRFAFKKADMLTETTWIENQIQHHDVILPLVAIATPATYVNDPLRIFELDFEANLAIVRLCVKHKKRLIFPSTSEVYGMCPDQAFDEENSVLVTGPIQKERWIYSCAKQMMDRIIYAYGQKKQLNYTLFRPFNWMGARLDNIFNPKPGGSRVITQFIGNILRGEPIYLVDGGNQKRSFTDIDDGIDALLKIIANKNQCAENKIFNIGNPDNNLSIRALAELLIQLIKQYPAYQSLASKTVLQTVSGQIYFGKGYQDIQQRLPSVVRAKTLLNWTPMVSIQDSLTKILNTHLL